MSVCECLDNMDIPEEVRTWGEECLEPDDPYRVIGDELFSFIEVDELTSMYSNIG